MMDTYLLQLVTFLMVLTRVSGWVMTVPFLGGATVPVRFRAFFAIGLALLLTPLQHEATTNSPAAKPINNLIDMAIALGHEFFVGLAIGLAIMFLFSGLQLAGQLISQLGGLAVADIFDPTAGTSAPIFSQFLRWTGLAVFLAIGGHRQIMLVMLDSYVWMPAGAAANPGDFTPTLVNVLTMSFVMGLRAAAPIIVALLLSMLILALIGRTLPQLNILAVGFSVNAMVTMITLLASVSAIYYLFDSYVERTIEQLYQVLSSAIT